MTAVKAPCAANAVEPDTGDRMYPTPIADIASATRREALGESVLISTNIWETSSGSFQSTSLESDVEQCGVVTDSGNDDVGARDHTANIRFALKVCAGGAFTSLGIAR